MNTRSLRFRLITWYAGLLVVLVSAFGVYVFLSVDHYLSDSLKQRQERRIAQIIRTLGSQINFAGRQLLAREFDERYAPELNDRFIRVSTADGQTLYVSGQPADRSFDPTAVATPPGDTSQTVYRSENTRSPYKLDVVSVPYTTDGKTYWIEVGASEAPDKMVLHGLLRTLLAGLSGVVVIAGFGGYILLTSALRPVREAIQMAREITLLDLGKRLPVYPSGDEIEKLSITFNQMINRLDDYFQATRRFTSDASHELQTPLLIIRGDIETLLMRGGLSEEVRERLESLLTETDRLTEIVKSLLALSRLDADGLHRSSFEFDMAKLAAATVELVHPLAADKQISLVCEDSEPIYVVGDETRMKQVIVNLVDNAIKYTPAKGRIDVAVTADRQHAILTVTDSGPGVPEESLPMIFERFYRGDAARSHGIEGAGLGLSIVSAICSAHRGRVRAENLPDGGCRFTVEIPLAKKAKPKSQELVAI